MELRWIHLFPDLMSLYGSYANLSVLTRLMTQLGHAVSVTPVLPGQPLPEDGDLIFMGAGTERAADAALKALRPWSEALKRRFEEGTPLFFAGTALDLLGREIREPDGSVRPGLGLAEFTVQREPRRTVGDVLGLSPLSAEPVVGYMNKCSRVLGVRTPLLTSCALGFGNEEEGGAEGWQEKNSLGSHLTGPLLVKNPALLRHMAEGILTRRGAALPDAWPRDPHAQAGYQVTVRELTARLEGQAPGQRSDRP